MRWSEIEDVYTYYNTSYIERKEMEKENKQREVDREKREKRGERGKREKRGKRGKRGKTQACAYLYSAHSIYLSPHVATSGHCIPVVAVERRGGSVGRRQRRGGNGWDEVA